MSHGTTARYAAGCRCATCRAARADYMRSWRQRSSLPTSRDRAQNRAYRAAEVRLRETHREEFERYYADERRKAGL